MNKFDDIDKTFLRNRAELKWGRWEEDVISMSVADIDFPAPLEIRNALHEAVDQDRTPYGAYGGDPDVLEVLCEKLNRVNGIPAQPSDVHIIPGTMFSIFLACYYALKPGEEAVICPAPVYPPFMNNIKNAGGAPVFIPLDFTNDCRLDLDLLESRITPRTRMIMVCNPHNPSGRVMTREELETIGRIAREHDLLIFSDELYEDTVMEGEHVSLASLNEELFERTLTVFGFSKAFGVPGYRVAYLVNRGAHLAALQSIMHDIIVHTDRLAQAAAKAATAYGGPWLVELNAHLKQARDYSFRRVSAMPGITCTKPQAAYFLFPDISAYGLSSAEMTDYLRDEARIIVQNGAEFGPHGEGHIRINYATALPVLQEAFTRMEGALGRLRPADEENRR